MAFGKAIMLRADVETAIAQADRGEARPLDSRVIARGTERLSKKGIAAGS